MTESQGLKTKQILKKKQKEISVKTSRDVKEICKKSVTPSKYQT
jgi:hypothetical protein